jgi:hypothetical protein
MSNPSFIYVLAEDERQRQFIYRFLAKAGYNLRQMRIEVSPSGQGSAEQWVRQNYVRQTKICRARKARASTGMFVLMDADDGSVQEHLRELDAALIAEGQPKFNSATDKIARLIPKWSIETWILFLISNGVNTPLLSEDEPYKNSKAEEQWSKLIPDASETFFAWTKAAAKIPNNLLNSLHLALQEIPKVLPARR